MCLFKVPNTSTTLVGTLPYLAREGGNWRGGLAATIELDHLIYSTTAKMTPVGGVGKVHPLHIKDHALNLLDEAHYLIYDI